MLSYRSCPTKCESLIFLILFLLLISSRCFAAYEYMKIDVGDLYKKSGGPVDVSYVLLANSGLCNTHVKAFLDGEEIYETVHKAGTGSTQYFTFTATGVGQKTLSIRQYQSGDVFCVDSSDSVTRRKSFYVVDPDKFSISVKPDNSSWFDYSSPQGTIIIKASTPWKIVAPDWVYGDRFSILKTTGEGDARIPIRISRNTLYEPRKGAVYLSVSPEIKADIIQYNEGNSPGSHVDLAPFLNILLLNGNQVSYVENDSYYKLKALTAQGDTNILVFKGSTGVDGAVVSRTKDGAVLTTNYYPMPGSTRIAITARKGDKGFFLDFANTSNVIAKLDKLQAGADDANKEILLDFINTYSPVQQLNSALGRLEVTLPKTMTAYLSKTSYVSRIMSQLNSGQLGVMEDDPVIGWYFDDPGPGSDFEYVLPSENNGGTVTIYKDPVIFDDSLTKVTYREDSQVQSYETSLFRINDFVDSHVFSKDDHSSGIYNVCISNPFYKINVLHRTPLDYEQELYTYLLSYTADGKCSLNPDAGSPIYLSAENMNYKVDVVYGPEPPDRAQYSCLGSIDESGLTFGDSGFSLKRIWIGVLPR